MALEENSIDPSPLRFLVLIEVAFQLRHGWPQRGRRERGGAIKGATNTPCLLGINYSISTKYFITESGKQGKNIQRDMPCLKALGGGDNNGSILQADIFFVV